MKVAIIGAGAIGLLIGSYLSEQGNRVEMVVRNEKQKQQLAKEGILRKSSVDESYVKVQATTDLASVQQADLCILAMKYTDVEAVLEQLKSLAITTPLLFIQNGLAHYELVEEGDFRAVAFATVEHGAVKEDHHIVCHNGVGWFKIGHKFGECTVFKQLEQYRSERFPIELYEEALPLLLRKTLMNCMINPLTAILQVPNGELVRNEVCHELMRRLYEECLTAFPEMTSLLPLEEVEAVCSRTAENESSMLVDLKNSRPIEVETIVTAVIQLANRRGHTLPLLSTYEKLLIVMNGKVR